MWWTLTSVLAGGIHSSTIGHCHWQSTPWTCIIIPLFFCCCCCASELSIFDNVLLFGCFFASMMLFLLLSLIAFCCCSDAATTGSSFSWNNCNAYYALLFWLMVWNSLCTPNRSRYWFIDLFHSFGYCNKWPWFCKYICIVWFGW